MSKTIWKYDLEVTDKQVIHAPKGAKFLTVQTQKNTPCLWVLVDPDIPRVSYSISTYGTGHKIDDTIGTYIGTYMTQADNFVGHVFNDYTYYN